MRSRIDDMKKFLFSYGTFTQDYILKITQMVPSGWHVIHTTKETDLRKLAPDILFVLSGSAAHQKRQTVLIRFGCGSVKRAFVISLGSLTSFFQQFETRAVGETETDEEHGTFSINE